MREGEGWSVCGAPLGLGESIEHVADALVDVYAGWFQLDVWIWDGVFLSSPEGDSTVTVMVSDVWDESRQP